MRKRLYIGSTVLYLGSDRMLTEGKVIGIDEDKIKIREKNGKIVQENIPGLLLKMED